MSVNSEESLPSRRDIFRRPAQAIRVRPDPIQTPESSADIWEKLSNSRISRRNILKAAGVGMGALAVNEVKDKLPFPFNNKAPLDAEPQKIETTESPLVPQPIIQPAKIEPQTNHPIEKSHSQTKIDKSIKDLLSRSPKEYCAQTLKNTQRWQPLIEEILKDPRYQINEEDRQKYKDLLLGLIYVESEGIPKAQGPILNKKTGDRAEGLLQLVPSQILNSLPEIRDQRGLDLYDPETNLRVGVRWLKYLSKHYPNLELLPPVHNLGFQFMIKLIKKAAIESGEKSEIVETNFETMGADGVSPTATAYYINKLGLGLEQLFENPRVEQPVLESSDYTQHDIDDTYKYPAAIYIVKNSLTQPQNS